MNRRIPSTISVYFFCVELTPFPSSHGQANRKLALLAQRHGWHYLPGDCTRSSSTPLCSSQCTNHLCVLIISCPARPWPARIRRTHTLEQSASMQIGGRSSCSVAYAIPLPFRNCGFKGPRTLKLRTRVRGYLRKNKREK